MRLGYNHMHLTSAELFTTHYQTYDLPSGSGVKVLKSGKIHTGATNMSTTCKVVSK